MKAQEPQCWNREKSQRRTKKSEAPHVAQRMESRLRSRSLVTWTASSHCGRCRGLMCRIELRDWGGSRGQDGHDALQCILCGDIIDPVIMRNRRRVKQPPRVGRKAERRFRVIMALRPRRRTRDTRSRMEEKGGNREIDRRDVLFLRKSS